MLLKIDNKVRGKSGSLEANYKEMGGGSRLVHSYWAGLQFCRRRHYLLHLAFWECPGVFQLCQKPGSGSPEDHPNKRETKYDIIAQQF